MYAVIKTGGKQYKVSEGDSLTVEQLPNEIGDSITLSDVLMVAEGDKVSVGAPVLENATVQASVVDHGRHKKIHILKFKRRKHHMKQMGHRQNFTKIKIDKIVVGA